MLLKKEVWQKEAWNFRCYKKISNFFATFTNNFLKLVTPHQVLCPPLFFKGLTFGEPFFVVRTTRRRGGKGTCVFQKKYLKTSVVTPQLRMFSKHASKFKTRDKGNSSHSMNFVPKDKWWFGKLKTPTKALNLWHHLVFVWRWEVYKICKHLYENMVISFWQIMWKRERERQVNLWINKNKKIWKKLKKQAKSTVRLQ